MQKIRKLMLVLFCCFSLWGCSAKTSTDAPRLVTQILVSARHEDTELFRRYTQPEKMEVILYYLRTIDPSGSAKTDPERILGDSFQINVQFSDGSEKIYRQRANQFLSCDSRPWQTVNPQKARMLLPLLESMADDPDQPAFKVCAVMKVYGT